MKINMSLFLQRRFNIYACRLMGWRAAFAYITSLGKLYFFFNQSEKTRIRHAVQSVFDRRKNPVEIGSVTAQVFLGIIFHYYEKFFNAFASGETLRAFIETHIQSEGMSALDEGLAKGKGVLLVTGHFGGVELIPAFLGSRNYKSTIVARFSSERLRQESLQQAGRFSVKIIDADQTPNVLRAISDHLKQNRIVITQCDEIDEWRPSRQYRMLFLGKSVGLDKTLNILSKRCAAPVVFGVMHRNVGNGYKFVATSWEDMALRHKSTAEMPMGAVILKFMEQYIYNYPQEWYQWKKYPALDRFITAGTGIEAPATVPLMSPSFAKP
jgi:KDO2-lipid IV(A) lauroyltransferase